MNTPEITLEQYEDIKKRVEDLERRPVYIPIYIQPTQPGIQHRYWNPYYYPSAQPQVWCGSGQLGHSLNGTPLGSQNANTQIGLLSSQGIGLQ